jgi:uncharacterized protein
MKRWLILLAATLLGGCSGIANGGTAASGCVPGTPAAASEAGLDVVQLCLTSGKITHRFATEIARTPPQQAKGMMFRTKLADDKAMLFPFSQPRMASFWMKNTVIPLDIIFIRADGKIENIAANTTPYSTVPVESSAPVTAVLEVRGGLAAEKGIKPGDIVRWSAR